MKVRNILVLVVLIWGLMGSIGFGNHEDDDYGKLVGWIVDPISEKPVNEVFIVELFRCDITTSERYLKHWKTDKRGYFSLEVNPGQYCLHIQPESMNSKYCIEPYHFYNDQFIYPVMIEKGKITEFRKKATIGGAIEIRLLDISGRQINPSAELPEGAEVSVSIDSSFYLIGEFSQYPIHDDIANGKAIVRTLYPSEYTLRVDFNQTGYKSIVFNNILVKENEITEIDCVIDLNDITGIEGRVVDINGNPVKGLKVFLSPKFVVGGSFSDFTDQGGNYRITGLPAGSYHIGTSSLKDGVRIYDEIIEIKKGVLIRKDVIDD